MKNKNKQSFFKKIIFVLFFSFVLSLSPLFAPKSQAWMAMAAAAYGEALRVLHENIKGIQLGILKQQALRSINSQIESLIGGGSSTKDAMFITDWEDYLIKQPENNTRKYMNDYLTQVTGGRGSFSGYQAEGFDSGMANYQGDLFQLGKSIIENEGPKVTYEGDPAHMFDDGNFYNMSLYLSGINNPWSFKNYIAETYSAKMEQEQQIAQAKAIAYQGFKGTGEDQNGQGIITNPGSLIKENIANAQDLGNKIIASADHIPEVITAVVSQMITKSIQNGIGNIQKNLQKENFLNNISGTLQIGPVTIQKTP